jgi:fatty-acid desaturase
MKTWPLFLKTRLLQLIHLLGALASLYWIDWKWAAVALGSYIFLETFGGNIGLHRYFGHHSFKTSRPIDRFLCVVANMVGAGSTFSWVGSHRYSDTPQEKTQP